MGLIEQEINGIVNDIISDFKNGRDIDRTDIYNIPDKVEVIEILRNLIKIAYPGYYRPADFRIYNVSNNTSLLIEDVAYNLNKQVKLALQYRESTEKMHYDNVADESERIVVEFLKKIPKIREYLDTDLQAALEGDPAAYNKDDIVLSYPGLYAITVNRLAHELFLLKVPLIPRIMTEYAHTKTGIDIHPGATIGKYFFIDHGTGIVIGETTTIGEHVKIYQGVTLGALSTRGGQKLKNHKRHPDIKDNVTIYSGASILGGETVIGEGTTIGGNVFITSSVDPGTLVSAKNQELIFKGPKNNE